MKKLLTNFLVLTSIASIAVTSSAQQQAKFGHWGVDLVNMNPKVKPGDDFFLYANGTWLDKTVIPNNRSSIGMLTNLVMLSEQRMQTLVHSLSTQKRSTLNGEQKQLRDLYDAFMNTKVIEAQGLTPIKADLARISTLKTPNDIANLMADATTPTSGIFQIYIQPNPKNPKVYAITLTQGGLGLPDRSYYLKKDPELDKTRQAYKSYLTNMLKLLGKSRAEQRAAAIYDLETKIAQAHWPAAETRDANKTYNPIAIKQLSKFAPGFPWEHYFKKLGINTNHTVILNEKSAFPKITQTIPSTSINVWRDYFTIQYLRSMAQFLPKKYADANFNFYGKVLNGNPQQLPRATRGVHLLDNVLSHPFGKMYVAKYFPPTAKAKVEQLVANLLTSYDQHISTNTWLTPPTRQKALDKLHSFTPHIGYPDKWRDFSGLLIKRNDLIGNIKRANQFEWNYRISRIDQPVDHNEWELTPSTVNAYYTQSSNAIFFPAAILQPPFFDPKADDAVNYGAIGMVIGHEISHGFDDQGSKYDGAGVLNNWWTDQDRKAFEAQTALLGAQFDRFQPLPGLFINGNLTMGENIADLSGVVIALDAYHHSLAGKPAPVLNGFTGDQRFFLSLAQAWQSKYRDAILRRIILSDPHSPPHYRVIGLTRNIDAWYRAFNIKSGDKMYLPEQQRVRLW